MVVCECGRVMEGNTRGDRTYYRCFPRGNNLGRPDAYAGHPKTVYVREKTIMAAFEAVYAERVFGPQRRELLAADLCGFGVRSGAWMSMAMK